MITNWHDKKVLIMGFSLSGKSAAKYLAGKGTFRFIFEIGDYQENIGCNNSLYYCSHGIDCHVCGTDFFIDHLSDY